MAVDPNPDPEVFYDVATARLSEQLSGVDALDAKTATAFSFASAILAFYGVILALNNVAGHPANHAALLALLVAGFVVYVLCLICLYKAYVARTTWSTRPNLEELQDYSLRWNKERLEFWVGLVCAQSVKENQAYIMRKVWYQRVGFILIAVETALAAATGLVALFVT